jgi:WD40 repeat protein
MATAGQDGGIRAWDPDTGRPSLAPIEHGGAVSALVYDPSGGSLASGGMDGMVRVWSSGWGRPQLGPLRHNSALTCLAYSPDGRVLAGGGGVPDRAGNVTIWGARRGHVRSHVESPRGIDGLSFSPDGQRIATCRSDALVRVWDTSSGHETLTLKGHGKRVTGVLFAPRGLSLYSAGRDGVVKAWDGGDGRR